jgi:hypothetical protein
MHHQILVAAALAALYALADRFAGGGAPKVDDALPGRAALWGFLACALGGYFLVGWGGVAVAVAWFAWRTPPWKLIPGGSITPVAAEEIAATYLRHALVAPLVALMAAMTDHAIVPAMGIYLLWAFMATGLAAYYGRYKADAEAGDPVGADPNWWIELTRGALFGLAAAAALR